jgi:hypothetical protein
MLSSPPPSQKDLADAITKATRLALLSLFDQHPEHFYYISLITTGEAHAPFIAAWSTEALAAETRKHGASSENLLKWSYADSPYMCFGEHFFGEVNQLFSLRPQLDHTCSTTEWEVEHATRLSAMEYAMRQLDNEGLFGQSFERSKVVINVEVMPPDQTNTTRAMRLNPESALVTWLEEASEK